MLAVGLSASHCSGCRAGTLYLAARQFRWWEGGAGLAWGVLTVEGEGGS